MNIIKTYLDNMFASLPDTSEVRKLKNDLLINMEEKYNELKAKGKTENEAIGIVISEFGNIEELAQELGIEITKNTETGEVLSLEVAKDFLGSAKKIAPLIAFGVSLCIISPILLLVLLGKYGSFTNSLYGFVALFVLVATAVGLFIYSGVIFSKFTYLNDIKNVPLSVTEYAKIQQKEFEKPFAISLITSVILFIISPVLIVIFAVLNNETGLEKYNVLYAVAVMLGIVAIACYIIIQAGLIKDSHNMLLKKGEYAKYDKQNENKSINALAAIYWPLVTIGYFAWSFLGSAWHISWIVWLIAGILFGGISEFIQTLSKDKNEK